MTPIDRPICLQEGDARTRLYELISDGYTADCWPPMPLKYRIRNAFLRARYRHRFAPKPKLMERIRAFTVSERQKELCAMFFVGAMMATTVWVFYLDARDAAWNAIVTAERARTAAAQVALADRCPVPLDGQVIGSRRDGRAVCVAVDNLQLPKVVK